MYTVARARGEGGLRWGITDRGRAPRWGITVSTVPGVRSGCRRRQQQQQRNYYMYMYIYIYIYIYLPATSSVTITCRRHRQVTQLHDRPA